MLERICSCLWRLRREATCGALSFLRRHRLCIVDELDPRLELMLVLAMRFVQRRLPLRGFCRSHEQQESSAS